MSITFSVTEKQHDKIQAFLNEQTNLVMEKRRDTWKNDPPPEGTIEHARLKMEVETGRPYEGMSAGRASYEFTSTSLGTVLRVIDNLTQEVIDVTDYDGW